MKSKQIIDAYCKIREIDQTIPDDVLDFMKQSALDALNGVSPNTLLAVEFGYKQCEKGNNLQMALNEFNKLMQ